MVATQRPWSNGILYDVERCQNIHIYLRYKYIIHTNIMNFRRAGQVASRQEGHGKCRTSIVKYQFYPAYSHGCGKGRWTSWYANWCGGRVQRTYTHRSRAVTICNTYTRHVLTYTSRIVISRRFAVGGGGGERSLVCQSLYASARAGCRGRCDKYTRGDSRHDAHGTGGGSRHDAHGWCGSAGTGVDDVHTFTLCACVFVCVLTRV